jgi:pimeloyl-ACP methyl ester carboxylesterase
VLLRLVVNLCARPNSASVWNSAAQMRSALPASELVYFSERGSGPPLLLVHGLMVTGEMFETVVERFATRHRVIVPDLRGHGRSRRLPPPYTARQLAADLRRLLDHLGIESAAVLGYSQGGAIAQQLALDDPKQCNRLVLACTYAFNMATASEQLIWTHPDEFVRVTEEFLGATV